MGSPLPEAEWLLIAQSTMAERVLPISISTAVYDVWSLLVIQNHETTPALPNQFLPLRIGNGCFAIKCNWHDYDGEVMVELATATRLELASQFPSHLEGRYGGLSLVRDRVHDWGVEFDLFEYLILDRADDFRYEKRSRIPTATPREMKVLSGISLAGAIYGGLHLTAWQATFPTLVERLL